jgi:hypothetical protein
MAKKGGGPGGDNMTWWLVWLIFVAFSALLGFAGYHFSVRTLRFFAAVLVTAVIVLVTRYGVTHSAGSSADIVSSFRRGFNDLGMTFFQPFLGRHVPLPGLGWLAIVAALVFGYRELEVWAMHWEPPTVDTSALARDLRATPAGNQQGTPSASSPGRPDEPLENLTGSQLHARLIAELRFRLPAVAVRAPAILPGGTRPNELASIAENIGVTGSGLAGAIIRFAGALWPSTRRYQVRAWVEHHKHAADGGERATDDIRVTVDLEDLRTGGSIATKTLVAANIGQAASVVAGYVGRHIFKADPTAPPWCVGSCDGDDLAGLLLTGQERVSAASPGDVCRSRQKQIGMLEGCRLDAGVARYELAQLCNLEGHHVKALRLHASNREDYPRFYRGRYRLGMSLEMIANPEFPLPVNEMTEMRESLQILDRCGVTEDAERALGEFTYAELPDELRDKLLDAAAKELGAVRRQLTLRWAIWEMFLHRDERAIRRHYWRLRQRERFHDGARVAELLVAVRRRSVQLDHKTKRAMNIVAAITGDDATILNPGARPRELARLPGPNERKTRWLYWQCRTPSWEAAYNTACLYAALAHQSGDDPQVTELFAKRVVRSLTRVVSDPDCEMERPWDWISIDPDFGQLKCSSPSFMRFRREQLDRDYPAHGKTCVFCRHTGPAVTITRERVFPSWRDELPEHLVMAPVIECVRTIPRGRQDGAVGPWPVAEAVGRGDRVVCEPCQSGWMASLEGAVRPLLIPLIAGSATELDPGQQITIATWAVLKAAVFEHVWTHDPVLTSADCDTIRTANHPPPGIQVRLARAASPGRLLRASACVFEPWAQGHQAFAVRMTIGCLVIQVFAGPGADRHSVRSAGRAGADFVGIFPPQPGTVPWPPPNALTDESLLGRWG